jgi:hypothetical protein
MNNNFFFHEVFQKEKLERMQKESEQARILRQLSKKREANRKIRINIREKIDHFKSRLATEFKSLSWSLR